MINSGSYQILLKIKREIELEIGHLGSYKFQKGFYFYTGSARKNLKQRIERHIRKEKKLHWHIDYLLNSNDVKIIDIFLFYSTSREECDRNKEVLELQGSSLPCKNFGSSDCSKCFSHLVRFKYKKDINGYLKKIKKFSYYSLRELI